MKSFRTLRIGLIDSRFIYFNGHIYTVLDNRRTSYARRLKCRGAMTVPLQRSTLGKHKRPVSWLSGNATSRHLFCFYYPHHFCFFHSGKNALHRRAKLPGFFEGSAFLFDRLICRLFLCITHSSRVLTSSVYLRRPQRGRLLPTVSCEGKQEHLSFDFQILS